MKLIWGVTHPKSDIWPHCPENLLCFVIPRPKAKSQHNLEQDVKAEGHSYSFLLLHCGMNF